jgi:hypothetical protein
MELVFSSDATKPYVCARCGGKIDTSGVGSAWSMRGDKFYHLGCTPEAEAAYWLYSAHKCPTCKGTGWLVDVGEARS